MLENLPQNIEAEKAVLGAMLISRESLVDASSLLIETDFFDRKHQIIFHAILDVQDKSIPVDIQTVTEELINNKELDRIGGVPYLLELSQSAIAYTYTEHYINIVRDQSSLRQILLVMKGIINDYDQNEIDDISTFIGHAAREVTLAAERRRISDFQTSAEVTEKVKQLMKNQRASSEDSVTGLPTGYKKLNQLTHGFQPSDIIILAARPSVGKTALGLNLVFNVAFKTKKPIGIFSLEMPAEQLILRLIANRSCVDLGKIQTGHLDKREHVAVEMAMNEISATKIFIDDTPGIKLIDIMSKARKLKMENPDLAMIMVDYIGLITTGKQKIESRQLEVSEISRSLKELARELEIPILVICQLSRAVDARTNKKPMLSDLRESGSIEQDADQVFLIYREDYYRTLGIDTKDKKEEGRATPAPAGDISSVSVIVAKNRNGQTGEVELAFTKNIGRFDDPALDHEEEGQ